MESNGNIPLPKQKEGSEKNIETAVEPDTEQAAIDLYTAARERLLNVNNWHELCGVLSAEFKLTNSSGDEISGEPRKGCFLKIDIPGPGNVSGEGYDWVRVEEIIEEKTDDGEYTLMRVRPTANPSNDNEDIAHFLSDNATSNFVVQRKGKVVTAAVYGRNETPNTDAHYPLDKIRNAIVGTSAIAAISDAQWKSLTKGVVGSQG